MMDKTITHYGRKGMRWGVITKKDGPSGDPGGGTSEKTSSKSGPGSRSERPTTKPTSTKPTPLPTKSTTPITKKTAAQIQAERASSIANEAEYLRSIGRTDLAEKLEADYAKSIAEAQTVEEALSPMGEGGSTSGEVEEEKTDEEKKGKGGGGSSKSGSLKGKKGEEDSKKEDEKKKRKEALKLAETQKEMASMFSQEAAKSRQMIDALNAQIKSLQESFDLQQIQLQSAIARNDQPTIQKMRSAVAQTQQLINSSNATIKAQSIMSVEFTQRANEWNKRAAETKKEASHAIEIQPEDILHYGIKGMRWGIRRKNPSGSGKRKSLREEVKSLSDDELSTKLKRLRMEQEYVNLMTNLNATKSSKLKQGSREVGKILAKSGKKAVQKEADRQAQKALKDLIDKYSR